MRLAIVPFTDAHLDEAAALLAARHRADREREPELPASDEDVEVMRSAVRSAMEGAETSGVVALRGGRMAGYLLGSIVLPAPTSGMALFARPRTARIAYAGHAVAPEDGGETYRELYAALAARWLTAGCFAHAIELPASDQAARAAWFSLGFGQEMVRGLRDTGPLPEARARAEIRQAGSEDINTVIELVRANLRYHAGPPVFAPYLPETEPEQRRHQQELLADRAQPHWLAYRDRTAVAILTFVPPRPGIATPARTVHLQHGYTVSEERGSGVASALLDHAMGWARDAGYERCTVNWMAANLLGARFWQRSGFRPISYMLSRQVDERIAWAHGRAKKDEV